MTCVTILSFVPPVSAEAGVAPHLTPVVRPALSGTYLSPCLLQLSIFKTTEGWEVDPSGLDFLTVNTSSVIFGSDCLSVHKPCINMPNFSSLWPTFERGERVLSQHLLHPRQKNAFKIISLAIIVSIYNLWKINPVLSRRQTTKPTNFSLS